MSLLRKLFGIGKEDVSELLSGMWKRIDRMPRIEHQHIAPKPRAKKPWVNHAARYKKLRFTGHYKQAHRLQLDPRRAVQQIRMLPKAA